MALVLSGLPTTRFVFEGFLPARAGERAAAVQALIRRIAYASVAADPSTAGATPSRTLRFSLSDAAASASPA